MISFRKGVRNGSTLVAALCSIAVVAGGQQPANYVSVPLTDPASPATLTLRLADGGITVRGSNRRDVAVLARDHRQNPSGAETALRRLDAPSFTVDEEGNRIAIAVQNRNRPTGFEIQVPSRTNLKIGTDSGEIVVEGVEGELEINNVNGPITLTRVGGSIIASSTNQHIKATVTSVLLQKPMAFTSLNGHVDVTFPASLKANLKLRSDKGQVISDFEVTSLQTPASLDTRRDAGRLRIEVSSSVYGAVNGGGTEIELRSFGGNVIVRKGQ
jgi:hypothetical protein